MLEVKIEKIVPITDARDSFNRIIDEVDATDEMYVITKNGKPAAIVVGVHHLEKLTGINAAKAKEMKDEANVVRPLPEPELPPIDEPKMPAFEMKNTDNVAAPTNPVPASSLPKIDLSPVEEEKPVSPANNFPPIEEKKPLTADDIFGPLEDEFEAPEPRPLPTNQNPASAPAMPSAPIDAEPPANMNPVNPAPYVNTTLTPAPSVNQTPIQNTNIQQPIRQLADNNPAQNSNNQGTITSQ